MTFCMRIDDAVLGRDGVTEIVGEVGEPGELASAACVDSVIELPPAKFRLAVACCEFFQLFQVEP